MWDRNGHICIPVTERHIERALERNSSHCMTADAIKEAIPDAKGGAILFPELSAKRLQLLKEVVPGLSRSAVIWNAANPANALAWRETQDAARTLGVVLQSHEIKDLKDFEGALLSWPKTAPTRFSSWRTL